MRGDACSDWQPGDVAQDALLGGTLAATDEGCLFASSGDDTRTAIVWPRGFAARTTDDGSLEVLDPAGDVVVREGEELYAGGGFADVGESESDSECLLGQDAAFYIQSSVPAPRPTASS